MVTHAMLCFRDDAGTARADLQSEGRLERHHTSCLVFHRVFETENEMALAREVRGLTKKMVTYIVLRYLRHPFRRFY